MGTLATLCPVALGASGVILRVQGYRLDYSRDVWKCFPSDSSVLDLILLHPAIVLSIVWTAL